jgi:hypothetical protein
MRDPSELGLPAQDKSDPMPPPRPADIKTLEGKVGAPLPPDYLDLLSISNGGCPRLCRFVPDKPGAEPWELGYFLRLCPDRGDPEGIWQELEQNQADLKPRQLPIACDSLGNIVVLDFNTSPPAVKRLLREDDLCEEFVAKDFGRFVDVLEESPDQTSEEDT